MKRVVARLAGARAVQDYSPPDFAVRLAESRVGDMVRVYQHQQSFSAALPTGRRAPTLLDLVVSAYLQGVNDVVDAEINHGVRVASEREA